MFNTGDKVRIKCIDFPEWRKQYCGKICRVVRYDPEYGGYGMGAYFLEDNNVWWLESMLERL